MCHSGSCKLNFVWFYKLSATKLYIKVLITVNTQNIGFSTRKVLNVCYFYVLNVHLGGLLFMKFNVTENIKYFLSHFIYSLISIYTYSSAWNLFMISKQIEELKTLIIWVILVADVYALCYTVILRTFSKKIIYWYLKWINFYLSTLNYKYNSIVVLIQKWVDIFGFMK